MCSKEYLLTMKIKAFCFYFRFKKMEDFQNDHLLTTIENLSNEIFHEIFDYLDGFDVLSAFSNLNIRFQEILHSPLLQLKIKLSYSQPEDTFIKNWKEFVSGHRTQIFSNKILFQTDPFFFTINY